MRKILFIMLFFSLFLTLHATRYTVAPVYAATPCPAGELCNPLNTDTFQELVDKVAGFIINLGIALAALMIVIGGFQILTAGGKSEQVATGRKTITYAVIGLVILLIGKGFVSLIKDILGVT